MAIAVPRPRTTPSTILGPSAAPTTAPTMTFQDAIAQYQSQNQVSADAYAGLFPYLQNLGFKVERPTHAGGTLPSDDKIVDSSTGQVYDLIGDVGGPNQAWTLGTAGYWVNGKPSATPPLGVTNPNPTGTRGAPPPHNGNPNGAPTTGTAVVRGSSATNPYVDARNAQSRIRQQARGTGRSSTILAGFGNNPPTVRAATVIGGGY